MKFLLFFLTTLVEDRRRIYNYYCVRNVRNNRGIGPHKGYGERPYNLLHVIITLLPTLRLVSKFVEINLVRLCHCYSALDWAHKLPNVIIIGVDRDGRHDIGEMGRR